MSSNTTTKTSSLQRSIPSPEELKKKLAVSNFHPDAILRGAQLTVVGALRALQNPSLFTSEHYKQAAIAVAAGIAIRLAISIPVIGVRVFLWFAGFVVDLKSSTWDESIIKGLDFIQNYVLQVPFFMMTLMRYITPTLDNMFMDSLAWVDKTYYAKHEGEDASRLRETFYPNLRQYPTSDGSTHSKSAAEALTQYLTRLAKKAGISLAVLALSYIPYVGRLVLPAASFYTFKNVAGLGPAGIVFGAGIFLPRKYLVVFLQSYFASRSLMRELLEPYFARIKFTKEEKRHWFHDREGLLFGFGVGFYIFLRIPLLGVLIYGIAEASTAYLVTKITDPPPPPSKSVGFAASQQQWKNKHEFLNLSLTELDAARRANASQSSSNPLSTGPASSRASASGIPSDPPPAYSELRSR